MTKKLLVGVTLLLFIYLFTWPVSVEPVAWAAPESPKYEGQYAVNNHLSKWREIDIQNRHAPEDIAVDRAGNLYTGTENGDIVRMSANGSQLELVANTQGRPLGIVVLDDNSLIVADSHRGLLSVDTAGQVTVLSTESDGLPFQFTNEVTVANDGIIYFTDSTHKFSARALGNMPASVLDIYEHGPNGRLLQYDPKTKETTTLLAGLHYPNGLVLDTSEQYLLVCETAEYRIFRYWLVGEKKGQVEPVIEALPGFLDNISVGLSGRYWFTLISPRNFLADLLSNWPQVRKAGQRLPQFLQPGPKTYGHVIAMDENGEVLFSLQDPSGSYPFISSIIETPDYLYLGSMEAGHIARLDKAELGI